MEGSLKMLLLLHAGFVRKQLRVARYNAVFASHGKEDQEEIYPLTVTEISNAQHADKHLRKFFKRGGDKASTFEVSLVEETEVLKENSKLVIPKSFQKRAVMWYHHYLQHPGET